MTAALHWQGPNAAVTPFLFYTLRHLVARNPLNQDIAYAGGAITVAQSVLVSNVSHWRHNQAILLLAEMIRDNSDVKNGALQEGWYFQVSNIIVPQIHQTVQVI